MSIYNIYAGVLSIVGYREGEQDNLGGGGGAGRRGKETEGCESACNPVI